MPSKKAKNITSESSKKSCCGSIFNVAESANSAMGDDMDNCRLRHRLPEAPSNSAPPEIIAQAMEMMAVEAERRGHMEAAAYYRDGRCPPTQTDITVICQALMGHD